MTIAVCVGLVVLMGVVGCIGTLYACIYLYSDKIIQALCITFAMIAIIALLSGELKYHASMNNEQSAEKINIQNGTATIYTAKGNAIAQYSGKIEIEITGVKREDQ